MPCFLAPSSLDLILCLLWKSLSVEVVTVCCGVMVAGQETFRRVLE
jgi:hypothetical protein